MERDVGCDASNAAVGANDAAHVRPVPPAVVRKRVWHRSGAELGGRGVCIERVADQVESFFNATSGSEATAQLGMVVVNPGVYHGHSCASTRQPQFVLRDIDAGHGECSYQIRNRPWLRLALLDRNSCNGKNSLNPGEGAYLRCFER
jgi:hypothetical protein